MDRTDQKFHWTVAVNWFNFHAVGPSRIVILILLLKYISIVCQINDERTVTTPKE